MRKIKRPNKGEYVLLTRWRDKDPRDPWVLGFLAESGEDQNGCWYKVEGWSRSFRNCFRLTKHEGIQWISDYGRLPMSQLQPLHANIGG